MTEVGNKKAISIANLFNKLKLALTVINSKIIELRDEYPKEFDSLIDGLGKEKID